MAIGIQIQKAASSATPSASFQNIWALTGPTAPDIGLRVNDSVTTHMILAQNSSSKIAVNLGAAQVKFIPNNQGVSFRNSADSADNISWTDAGAVTVRAGLTVTAGGLTVTAGGLTVSASGITVTGNSTITGTLGGLTGLTVASGGAAITGNSTVTGTLGVTSDFAVNTNKFTVAASSGNTVVAGTLGVTGLITATGGTFSSTLTASNGFTVSAGTVTLPAHSVLLAAVSLNNCSVYYGSGGYGLPTSTSTAITFLFENSDPNAMHSTSSNTSRVTAPVTGSYRLTFVADTQPAGTAGNINGYFRKNGTTQVGRLVSLLVDATINVWPVLVMDCIVDLTAGDYVEAMPYRINAGGSILTDATFTVQQVS